MPGRTPLILVADAGRASMLQARADAPGYDEVGHFENPDAHRKDHELGADRPGRVFDSHTGRASAIEPHEGPRAAARREFAAVLAAALDRAATADQPVALVAPARFLALLRAALPAGLAARVAVAEDADLTRLPRADLFVRLDALLRPARGAG